MKRHIAILAAILATTATFAGQGDGSVSISGGAGYGQYQSGSGGEFTFTAYNDGNQKLYSNLIGDNPFQTFCVEEGEFVYPNSTYATIINTKTVFSNVTLNAETAFLYTQFQLAIHGQSSYFDGGNYGGNSVTYDQLDGGTSAQALQNAIWYYMLQGGANNAYAQLANWAVSNNVWSGLGNVRVLNLWQDGHAGENGYQRQDMLVQVVPVPAAVLLGGLGIVVAFGLRRMYS